MWVFIFVDFMFLANVFRSNQSRFTKKHMEKKKQQNKTGRFRYYHASLDQKINKMQYTGLKYS